MRRENSGPIGDLYILYNHKRKGEDVMRKEKRAVRCITKLSSHRVRIFL